LGKNQKGTPKKPKGELSAKGFQEERGKAGGEGSGSTVGCGKKGVRGRDFESRGIKEKLQGKSGI